MFLALRLLPDQESGAGLFHWLELSESSPRAMLPTELTRAAQAKGGPETLVNQCCL